MGDSTDKAQLKHSSTERASFACSNQHAHNKDELINAYFARLCEYRHQLAGTAEAISDEKFRTHIYTTVPKQFKMTIRILKRQPPASSVEEVMGVLREDADTDALTIEIGDVSTAPAIYASCRGRGRGRDQF